MNKNYLIVNQDVMMDIFKKCGGVRYSLYMVLLARQNGMITEPPSTPTLAKECNITLNAVKTGIEALKQAGYITSIPYGYQLDGTYNYTYTYKVKTQKDKENLDFSF